MSDRGKVSLQGDMRREQQVAALRPWRKSASRYAEQGRSAPLAMRSAQLPWVPSENCDDRVSVGRADLRAGR